MLNGDLQTVVDTEKLNISLLANATPFFNGKQIISILHDCSPIRKPESKTLDSLGKVTSLSGGIVNGYDSFNSVAIDVAGKQIRLLACRPFSNGEVNYVCGKERYGYENGQLADPQRRKAIAGLDAAGSSYNLKTIIQAQLNQISEHLLKEAPQLSVVHIFDRGFDDAALFALVDSLGHSFICRGKANRKGNQIQLDEQGKERCLTLLKEQMMQGQEQCYEKIRFKKRVYSQAKGVFEWTRVEIADKQYSVVRVSFYARNGSRIFKEPMLLLTNLQVDDLPMAQLVFEQYMQRSKIEAVFKFCKEELKWESPRMDDFTAMKNLLSLVYFIAGYFYEIAHELTANSTAEWLAELGNGKGKVSPHFLLKGLAKVAAYLEIQQLIEQNKLSQQQIQQAVKLYSP